MFESIVARCTNRRPRSRKPCWRGMRRAAHLEQCLEGHGLVVLRNEVWTLQPPGARQPLHFVGLDDEFSGRINPEIAFQSMAENPETNKARFLGFWTAVSEHFKNAPDSVTFELLNEPNGKLTADLWNQYLAEALAIVRRSNPTRAVIVGPVSWNAIRALPSLKLPAKDRHLIVTVHYYDPMSFTHQGASWAPQYTTHLGVQWTGSDAEKKAVLKDFQKANDWAKTNNRPLFLGEVGAYDEGDMESRVRYTAHVARTAESFHWSWAYWQFDSDFVLYRVDKNEWVEPIRNALIP